MSDISPAMRRGKQFGWRVQIESESILVAPADLPMSDYPTEHTIRHAARAKYMAEPADKIALADAIDACLALAVDQWQSAERIRSEAVRRTGIDSRKAHRMEDSGYDHNSAVGIDTTAQEFAELFPELGWDRDDSNGAALWEILKTPKTTRPKRSDYAIRASANAMLQLTRRAPAADVVPF